MDSLNKTAIWKIGLRKGSDSDVIEELFSFRTIYCVEILARLLKRRN